MSNDHHVLIYGHQKYKQMVYYYYSDDVKFAFHGRTKDIRRKKCQNIFTSISAFYSEQ